MGIQERDLGQIKQRCRIYKEPITGKDSEIGYRGLYTGIDECRMLAIIARIYAIPSTSPRAHHFPFVNFPLGVEGRAQGLLLYLSRLSILPRSLTPSPGATTERSHCVRGYISALVTEFPTLREDVGFIEVPKDESAPTI